MVKLYLVGESGIRQMLAKAEQSLIDGVDREIQASAHIINAEQKALSPVDNGTLRAGNVIVPGEPKLTAVLENRTHYAPYQEWGTGGLVSVPAELEAEALQFKGRGIRQVNMAAQPFFFAPYFAERAKLITRIKKMLSS